MIKFIYDSVGQPLCIVFSLLLFLISSCTMRVGEKSLEKHTPQTIAQIVVPGKTTESDILKTFGEPGFTSEGPYGKHSWIYSFSVVGTEDQASYSIGGRSLKGKSLKVVFDKEGKVIDYEFGNFVR